MRNIHEIELRIPWHRLPDPPPRVRRLGHHFAILLQGRWRSFLLFDSIFVTYAFTEALVGGGLSGGQPSRLFLFIVLVPLLVLGVPVLSRTLDVERQAGTLDLALSVADTAAFLRRRLQSVALFLVAQSWLLILLMGLSDSGIGAASTLRALLYSFLIITTAACVVLFWSLRLRSTGSVLVASLLTLAALGKWLVASPYPSFDANPGRILGVPVELLEFLWNCLMLALAAVIFYLYARLRLRHPEQLVS
jgi:hypothetical protein